MATLIAADYDGRVKDNLLVVQAKFDIFSPSEKSEVIVPLKEVDLLEGAVAGQDGTGGDAA